MARIVATATTMARMLTTIEVVFRRDAHWAPFETADMTLLPTWTPSGEGERRLSGRDGARTRGYPGSVGGWGPATGRQGARRSTAGGGLPARGILARIAKACCFRVGALRRRHTRRCSCAPESSAPRRVWDPRDPRADASRGGSGAPRRLADSSPRRGSARNGNGHRTVRTPSRAIRLAAPHRRGAWNARGRRPRRA